MYLTYELESEAGYLKSTHLGKNMSFFGDFRDFGSGIGLSGPIDAGRFRNVAGCILGLLGTPRVCFGRVLIISQIFSSLAPSRDLHSAEWPIPVRNLENAWFSMIFMIFHGFS